MGKKFQLKFTCHDFADTNGIFLANADKRVNYAKVSELEQHTAAAAQYISCCEFYDGDRNECHFKPTAVFDFYLICGMNHKNPALNCFILAPI